jgi:predicted transcriptional regulator
MQAAISEFRGESLAFVRRAIIRIVLADLLRTESGNMALQHLGILWIIYEYSDSDEPITTAKLQELTNVHGTTIIKYCTRLESLGLVKKTQIKASHGKGRAYAYTPGLPEELLSEAVKKIVERAFPFANMEAVSIAVSQNAAAKSQLAPPSESTKVSAPKRIRKPRSPNAK